METEKQRETETEQREPAAAPNDAPDPIDPDPLQAFQKLLGQASEIALLDPAEREPRAREFLRADTTLCTVVMHPAPVMAIDQVWAIVGKASGTRRVDFRNAVRALEKAVTEPEARSKKANDNGRSEKPKRGLEKLAARGVDVPEWAKQLITTQWGDIKGTLGNAIIILTHDDRWRGVLGYDTLAEQNIWLERPPWMNPTSWKGARSVTDIDDSMTVAWLEQHWGTSFGSADVTRALDVAARRNSFDPVERYLEGLTWDRVPRLDSMLATYAGVEPSVYHSAVGARWMIAGVARALQPGCKVDTALVFSGGQGQRKSTFFKVLGGAWFSDQVGTIGEKSGKEELAGSWLIELGELSAMSHATIEALKAWMTQADDKFRPAYGRRVEVRPRRCFFGATTNEDLFLKDPTGNRRWWVAYVGDLDIPALERDRDQLWAEAVSRFKNGERWWIDKDKLEDAALWAEATEAQEEARIQSPWEVQLAEKLSDALVWVTPGELLSDHLGIKEQLHKPHHLKDLANVMKFLGWTRTRRYIAGKRVRGYLRNGYTTGAEGKIVDQNGNEITAEPPPSVELTDLDC